MPPFVPSVDSCIDSNKIIDSDVKVVSTDSNESGKYSNIIREDFTGFSIKKKNSKPQ